MPWIESHQTLGHHPKTYRLAELLNINLPTAVGHLHFFWWWALDFALNGEIRTTPSVLARACEWRGNAEKFRDALLVSGFVERHDEALVIHDWMDYAGKLADQRALRRESNRRAQSARRQRLRGDDSADRQRLVSADDADNQQSTGPDRTIPDRTVPDTSPLPPSATAAEGGDAPPSVAPDLSTNGQTGGVRPRAGRVRPKAEVVEAPACCANFARTGEHWAKCPVALAEEVPA